MVQPPTRYAECDKLIHQNIFLNMGWWLGSYVFLWEVLRRFGAIFRATIGTVKVSWLNDSAELSRSLSFVSFEILSMEIQFGFASLHWLVVCVPIYSCIYIYIFIYRMILEGWSLTSWRHDQNLLRNMGEEARFVEVPSLKLTVCT